MGSNDRESRKRVRDFPWPGIMSCIDHHLSRQKTWRLVVGNLIFSLSFFLSFFFTQLRKCQRCVLRKDPRMFSLSCRVLQKVAIIHSPSIQRQRTVGTPHQQQGDLLFPLSRAQEIEA